MHIRRNRKKNGFALAFLATMRETGMSDRDIFFIKYAHSHSCTEKYVTKRCTLRQTSFNQYQEVLRSCQDITAATVVKKSEKVAIFKICSVGHKKIVGYSAGAEACFYGWNWPLFCFYGHNAPAARISRRWKLLKNWFLHCFTYNWHGGNIAAVLKPKKKIDQKNVFFPLNICCSVSTLVAVLTCVHALKVHSALSKRVKMAIFVLQPHYGHWEQLRTTQKVKKACPWWLKFFEDLHLSYYLIWGTLSTPKEFSCATLSITNIVICRVVRTLTCWRVQNFEIDHQSSKKTSRIKKNFGKMFEKSQAFVVSFCDVFLSFNEFTVIHAVEQHEKKW